MSWPSIDHCILSPSGHVSKRAERAAKERAARVPPPGGLFPDGFIPQPPVPLPSARDSLLRRAAELRGLAERGMKPRAYAKEAAILEALAEKGEGAMNESSHITVQQAAANLGLAVDTVRQYAREGKLTRYYPAGLPGKGLRFDAAEVERLARVRAASRELQPEITTLAEHAQRVQDRIEEDCVHCGHIDGHTDEDGCRVNGGHYYSETTE